MLACSFVQREGCTQLLFFCYDEIYNYLHTVVAQTFSLRTLLHKLKVCATAQSKPVDLGITCQNCAYILYFTLTPPNVYYVHKEEQCATEK